MDILPYNFRTCLFCGVWHEGERFLFLKKCYKFAVMFIVFQFTICQILGIPKASNSVDEFSDALFVTFTYVALCMKILNFVVRRREMTKLLQDFRSTYCQAKNEDELSIVRDYRRVSGKLFMAIMGLSQFTNFSLVMAPIMQFGTNCSILPYQMYEPYNISSSRFNYWMAYASQFVATIYGVFLNVSMDTMVYGFMMSAAGQFKINCMRSSNLSNQDSIKECMAHHKLLLRIRNKIESFFIRVIAPLFTFSLIILCTSIFRMSQQKIASPEFISLAMYFVCMLFMVYFYCWYGNELELQSKAVADSIYTGNWIEYSNDSRRTLRFAMMKAQSGSNISYHGQCQLSMDTFIWIVKTSYGAFNLLQQENKTFTVLKKSYKIFVMLIIFQFTIFQILGATDSRKSIEEFSDALSVSFTYVGLCMKIFNFTTRRHEMVELLEDFRSPHCLPKNDKEAAVISDYIKSASKLWTLIMWLSMICTTFLFIAPIIDEGFDTAKLPLALKLPKNILNDRRNYWIFYTLEMVSSIYGVALNVSMDTMVFGFLTAAKGQFKIHCMRLSNLSNGNSIKECVAHHKVILGIRNKIESFFVRVIAPCFTFSLIVLCTSIFIMSKLPIMSIGFVFISTYFLLMLSQVYIYCWFGNELKLQSSEVANAIYMGNWMDFNKKHRQSMCFLMLKAQTSSNISFHGQCQLSMSTFLWVVKTSYGAFNLLREVS
ncbi:hypothetical protein TKK_0001534 [Trichogramma kaykai]|uniref:Odorant receptor n=1 Tax=Trichogramma kaykai TaxID=54128 RepID=A0ABD2X2U4_9HYME